jgi:hypothetical protein
MLLQDAQKGSQKAQPMNRLARTLPFFAPKATGYVSVEFHSDPHQKSKAESLSFLIVASLLVFEQCSLFRVLLVSFTSA